MNFSLIVKGYGKKDPPPGSQVYKICVRSNRVKRGNILCNFASIWLKIDKKIFLLLMCKKISTSLEKSWKSYIKCISTSLISKFCLLGPRNFKKCCKNGWKLANWSGSHFFVTICITRFCILSWSKVMGQNTKKFLFLFYERNKKIMLSKKNFTCKYFWDSCNGLMYQFSTYAYFLGAFVDFKVSNISASTLFF